MSLRHPLVSRASKILIAVAIFAFGVLMALDFRSRPRAHGNYGSCVVALSLALDAIDAHKGNNNGTLPTQREFEKAFDIMPLNEVERNLVHYAPPKSGALNVSNVIILICDRKSDRDRRYVATTAGQIWNVKAAEALLGISIPPDRRLVSGANRLRNENAN
jgi:hypothetical protein